MTNYNELTRQEINQKIAVLLGEFIEPTYGSELCIVGETLHFTECGQSDLHACHKDYCDSPDDMWPIIVDNGISIKVTRCPAGSGFAHYAESYCGKYHTGYMDPLEAAGLVFLMMNENENGPNSTVELVEN